MYKKIDEMTVLELYFKELSEYSLREAGRVANINAMTARKYLEQLTVQGLLLKKRVRNTVLYSSNANNELFKLKKRCWNIEQLHKSGIIDYFNEIFSYPTIVLFGSYARAENTQRSDIDLLIIAVEKKELDLSQFEKQLGHSIQLFLHTKAEFKALTEKNPGLVNNILNGVVLSGYLDVL